MSPHLPTEILHKIIDAVLSITYTEQASCPPGFTEYEYPYYSFDLELISPPRPIPPSIHLLSLLTTNRDFHAYTIAHNDFLSIFFLRALHMRDEMDFIHLTGLEEETANVALIYTSNADESIIACKKMNFNPRHLILPTKMSFEDLLVPLQSFCKRFGMTLKIDISSVK